MNPATGQSPETALNPARARPGVYRLDARAILDGAGLVLSPGSLLLEVRPSAGTSTAAPISAPISSRGPALRGIATVLAVNTPGLIDTHPRARAAHRVDLPNSALLPPFVNAHTHLDLTHIGPCPHDTAAGFVGFVDLVRARRGQTDDDIAASVRAGIELSLRAGVAAVGDIAGAPRGEPRLAPWRTMADSPIRGVSFIEFFGIGKGEQHGHDRMDAALAQVQRELQKELQQDIQRDPPQAAGPGLALLSLSRDDVRIGLQPHAPSTIATRLYAHAARTAAARDLPICTHLAETPEERAFIAVGAGPQRELLTRLGVWDDSMLRDIGLGHSPIRHLADVLPLAPFIAVHVNDCSDADLQILARARTSIVYCPRASAYFSAERHFGPHRYRDFLSAGLTVALGTDSIINLPAGTDVADGPGLSILEEMRFLYARDHTDPLTLLAMGTIHGARVLGLDERAFTFKPGPDQSGVSKSGPSMLGRDIAGLVAIDLPDRRSSLSAVEQFLGPADGYTGNPRLLLIGK